MKTLAAIKKEVDGLTDTLGDPVDQHIRNTVIALMYQGFNTTASCEGHLDHGFPYPWVDIAYEDKAKSQKEKQRLAELLKQFYANREATYPLLLQDFADFRLQSVAWPQKKHRRSAPARPAADPQGLLDSYRQEMDAFADFLLNLPQATK